MNSQNPTDIILESYIFKRDKPAYTNGSLNTFDGIHKDTKVPVTIKILKPFHFELPKYLKKLKDCKSDNVIKVYDTISDNSTLVFITEKVAYGNMKQALVRCERLDDADSIFISKAILNGHIDLLRSDCNWFGTEEDIQFTETGLKMSWNNSIGFNLVNPLPKLLERISMRPEDNSGDSNLLPFPKNKTMLELIKISKENASEISLNPQMKKKEKFSKKKGKNWLGLKQYKNKNQYFDELIYLAISPTHGFIRVKAYQKGKLQPGIVNLNKTKSTFTRLIQHYDDQTKTYVISDYSNDGNLQAYVTKLKLANISLTQQHIEFFFYSMFEPVKQVQESSLKSLNMLHIRNIYIQSGIPRIGDPIPLYENMQQTLIDRSDVPDFYHRDFKKNPTSHFQSFDTYSLGVLLYKLMYTQYPIFPNNLVHIPTSPNYNKRLKKTLQIFLNKGGRIKDIQSQIEVSENVIKQVKQNKERLVVNVQKSKKKQEKKKVIVEGYQTQNKQLTQKSEDRISEQQQQYDDGDQIGCCSLCCTKLELTPLQQSSNKNISVTFLEQSPYKIYRICTKILLVLVFYIFLFYFFFLQNNILFIANQNILTNYTVTIGTSKYPIITTDVNKFETNFNTTDKTVQSLIGMGCLISQYDGAPVYQQFIYEHSSGWVGYIVAALISVIVILAIKVWQIYHFDIVRAVYNYDHGKYNFNISNWIIFNLLWIALVHGHYYFFNFIFRGQTQPCVGNLNPFASTYTFFNDREQFNLVYLTTVCLQLAITLGNAIMIGFTYRIKYNKILNPIFLFAPLLIVSWVIIRIGVIDTYFYPNALQDSDKIIIGFFTLATYVDIFGIIPELLLLGQLIISFLIDLIYWSFLDRRRRMLINQTSAASLPEFTA